MTPMPRKHHRNGLVLTGGGARAAYQAGVLKAIADLMSDRGVHDLPFPILTGVSAGAINCAYIASKSSSFAESALGLHSLWHDLRNEQVFRTDLTSLAALGSRWIKDLSLGGAFGSSNSTFLLDTHPLSDLLRQGIDFDGIRENVKAGRLHGVSVSATNYATGTAISFFDGVPEIEGWTRSSRLGRRETLSLDHILASAAIPILFQPVKLGGSYFGDGGIRLTSPLSPAIHLGAERILAIGIRYSRPDAVTEEINQAASMDHISVADIAGVLLNAQFLDALESDVERLERVNHTLTLIPEKTKTDYSLRTIPLLTIRPSADLGTLASEQFHKFPRMLRYLLRGLGASEEKGWDLLSYLSFDKAYTRRLLDLGYEDVLAMKDHVIEFLET
jgi:NTE family protein